jgi:hypothetical protein
MSFYVFIDHFVTKKYFNNKANPQCRLLFCSINVNQIPLPMEKLGD